MRSMTDKLFLPIALLAVLCLSACGKTDTSEVMVTGQIEGNGVNAGSRVGGRVVEVPVKEGARVKKGDVLIKLDDAEAQALVKAADADIVKAESFLANLETGATAEQLRQAEAATKAAEERWRMVENGARVEEIGAAQAAVDAARSQLNNARAEFDRASRLYENNGVSKSQYDLARTAMEMAEAQHRTAREKLDLVSKGARAEELAMARADFDRAQASLDEIRRGPRGKDIATARAARDAAFAARDRALVNLGEMVITAPCDAVIESLDVRPGDLIKPGAIVRLVDPEDLDVMIYVSATMLGRMRLGDKIPLTADAHGTERFEGEVVYIASTGEYTPRNLQTQEERVQQVFGVKLALNSNGGKLRPGMTVTAHLPASVSEP